MEAKEEPCLVNSAATNTILRETCYFQTLRKRTENLITIARSNGRIVGSEQAIVVLPNNTRIFIEEAFLYPGAQCTLLTFKDIRQNGYHVTTACEGRAKFLYITELDDNQTKVVEKRIAPPLEYTIQQSKPLKNMLRCLQFLRTQNLLKFGING